MAFLQVKDKKKLTLCVDFGTTNSVVSYYDDDKEEAVIIPFEGLNIIPSVIFFNKNDEEIEAVFGNDAKNSGIIYPESTVFSIKSALGKQDECAISIDDTKYMFSPTQIVSFILENIRVKANEYLENVAKIDAEFLGLVITVPANSTDKQKNKTLEAGILAGFEEDKIHIRLEPAAAAIGYASTCTKDSKVLIYDFGGGTFDACLVDIKLDNRKPVVSIKSTSGDNNLGGDNVDDIIFDIIYDEFLTITKNKIDLFNEDYSEVSRMEKKVAIARIAQTANSVKEKLSKTGKAKVKLNPILQKPVIVNINIDITSEMFLTHKRKYKLGNSTEVFEKYRDKNLVDVINMTIEEVERCISSCGVSKEEIDEVFLVGGSSSIGLVFEKVSEYFGKEPFKGKLNPALAISEGASIYSKLINNPEESILKYIETTVHSIGIEILGRRYYEIIKPNTPIPEEGLVVTCDGLIQTSFDNIDKVVIALYEYTKSSNSNVVTVSETGMIRLCGTTLKGIPLGEKGEEKISLTLSISRDNILSVSAQSCSALGVQTKLKVDELY